MRPAHLPGQPADLRVQVIDYDLATTFAVDLPGCGRLNGLQGIPAHLSPERTGRMNRPVDYRADLYSLGATR